MTSYSSPARLPALFKLLLVIVALLGFAGAPIAQAQDSSSSSEPAASSEPAPSSEAPPATPVLPSPDTVIATVNGLTITEGELAFAQEDLGQQLQQVPPEQVRAVLLAQLINLRLMESAARAGGLDQTDSYKRRLKYLETRALNRAYVAQEIAPAVTKESIQAEYDKQYGAASADELHVEHILVSTEDDAKAIKAALDSGTDFATLAKEKSVDPSAKQNGGDLGYIQSWSPLVKPFLDTAFALKDGEVSQPVQTQFGWHVIKVLDRRPATKPTVESVANQIGQQIYTTKYEETFNTLKNAATIDIPDPQLKAMVDASFAQ